MVTRRYHSGFIIFIGCAHIILHSKHQNTVEPTDFISEFFAITDAAEANQALCYKLGMLVIEVEVDTNVISNNNSVCIKSYIPKSIPNIKHNSIAYDDLFWSSAAK